jgi:hypothetical protein
LPQGTSLAIAHFRQNRPRSNKRRGHFGHSQQLQVGAQQRLWANRFKIRGLQQGWQHIITGTGQGAGISSAGAAAGSVAGAAVAADARPVSTPRTKTPADNHGYHFVMIRFSLSCGRGNGKVFFRK